MANDIVVRIGAVLDPRSFDVVLAEIARRSKQAEQALARLNVGGRGGYGGGRTNYSSESQYGPSRRDIEKAIAAQERANRQAEKQSAASERKQTSDHEKEERRRTAQTIRELKVRLSAETSLQRQRSAALLAANRADERAQAAHSRAVEREAVRAANRQERAADRFATRTSHRATRFFFPPPEGALGVAKRVGLDLARGAGVDLSLSGGLSRARERQSAATMLSGQGWLPKEQKFENRIGPEELRKVAKEQAYRLGLGGEDEVISAMSRFTDVTGDLATAKAVIGDIGLLARVSGTNLEDAASAAADMSMQLPSDMDLKTRQRTMQTLLNTAAMQGKLGAIEIKDLAKYAPKIVAQAGSFSASPEKTMTQLLATAQIARQYGGANNAATASTAVSAMVNTLKTPTRVMAIRKQFKAAGMTGEHADVYDQKTGLLRSMPEIIKDTILAASTTKDPTLAFKKMWGNVLGAKGPEGALNVARKAGGGEAGRAAIDEEFEKFTTELDPAAQQRMLDEIVKGQQTSANRFQQKLDEVTEAMGVNLYPTLEKLAPTIIELTASLGNAITWAADNPFKAVVLAMTASVARAGIESGIRAVLDKAAMSVFGSVAGNAAGGAVGALGGATRGAGVLGAAGGVVGTAAGVLGTIAALGAVGVAAYTVTESLLKLADASNQKAKQERVKSAHEVWQSGIESMGNAANPLARQQAYSKARQALLESERQRTGVANLTEASMSQEAKNTLGALGTSYDAMNAKDAEKRQRGTEQQQYQAATGSSTLASDIGLVVARELTGVMQKQLTVRVVNPEDFKFSSLVGSGFGAPPRE